MLGCVRGCAPVHVDVCLASQRHSCAPGITPLLLLAPPVRLCTPHRQPAGRSARPRACHAHSMQALELRPSYGAHLLLANRSGARLAMGDAEGALQDARDAVAAGPPGFTTGYVREAS